MRIRRGLSSRLLPCGCLAGIYETYRDEIVTIVDAKSAACADPSHVDGNVVPASPLSVEARNARHDSPPR
jgi:hypothetical protein